MVLEGLATDGLIGINSGIFRGIAHESGTHHDPWIWYFRRRSIKTGQELFYIDIGRAEVYDAARSLICARLQYTAKPILTEPNCWFQTLRAHAGNFPGHRKLCTPSWCVREKGARENRPCWNASIIQ